jgi:hypothetical protein
VHRKEGVVGVSLLIVVFKEFLGIIIPEKMK